MSHPNASITLLTTAASGLAYKLAQHYGWLSFTPEDGIIATGAIASVVLYVGRRGPVQTLATIWGWVRHGVNEPGAPFITYTSGSNTYGGSAPITMRQAAAAPQPSAAPASPDSPAPPVPPDLP